MSQSRTIELDYRPSYKAAAIASLVVLLLYVITLAPSTAMWDTSEYIAAAYVLGLPHPPGNPFFVLIGRVFSILPIAPSIAARVNLLAAISSAVSAGMWFLITERVLVSWLSERWMRIAGGALATLIGATAFTVWSQSVVNEKVYTVSLVGVAIIAWLTVKWCDDPDSPRSDKLLILIAYLLGLGYANHMAGFIAAPAVAIAVLLRRPRTILRWKLILAGAGVCLLGLTPFATQPIRAAYYPAISEGEPTACLSEIGWECTFSAETYSLFKYNFNRGQYQKPPLAERQAPFAAQVGLWWLYFKWQWLRDEYDQKPRLQAMLAAVFLMLGLFGGYVHWRRDRRSFMFFGPLMFTLTLVLIYYLNFKYGDSQCPANVSTDQCEVRDRDYFFIWSFSAWSVWAALGLVFIWESLAAMLGSARSKLGGEEVDVPFRTSWIKASPVLLIALVPLFANWNASSRRGETDTRDFAYDMLNSLEPYSVLVTVGDNDTFPLWYAQEVEKIRQDVTVVNTSLLNTDWYMKQLIRRPVRPFDPSTAPSIYQGRDWPMPEGPPLNLTLENATSLQLAYDLRQPQTFSVPGTQLVTTLEPRTYFRADVAVLQIIQDSYGKRPVYFSRTSGDYPALLGLRDFVLTQGLAQKVLYSLPDTTSGDTIFSPVDGWVDLKRTRTLWDSVFIAPESLIRKDKWIDKSSRGIPWLYVWTGLSLAQWLAGEGDIDSARQVLTRTGRVADAVRFNADIGPHLLDIPPALGDTGGPSLPLQQPPPAGDSGPPGNH